MSSPVRRNSSKPFIDYRLNKRDKGYSDNNGDIPNVMTSPAIFPIGGSSDTDLKDIGEEDSTISASSVSDMQKPPDGGWGWFVVFASFMIHVLADGITYTQGIYVVDLKLAFNEGSAAVSWISSILVGVTLGSGPIASILVNRYGCRVVTAVGAVLAAFGLAISAAANSLVLLYFSIGVCTGLGFGLIYLPAIVCVSMYFEKHRALATGIAVCGSGIGTFIWAPLTQVLINSYGWQYSLLITGAIVLLNIGFGALFRPVPVKSIDSGSTAETPDLAEEGEMLTKPYPTQPYKNHSFSCENGLPPLIKINDEPMKPLAIQMGNGNSSDGKYSQVARMALSHPVLPIQPPEPKSEEQYGSHSHIYDRFGNRDVSKSRRSSRRGSGVMQRKDIFYAGSLYNIPDYKDNPRRYSRYHIKLNEKDHRSRLGSRSNEMSNEKLEAVNDADKIILDEEEGDQETICCLSAEASKGLKQMVDIGLLKNLVFIMFVVSNFLTSIGFNVPYVYQVDRAVNELEIGKEDAKYLLSIVGIANTIGRVVLGFIADRPWVNRLYLYNTSLAICGLSMALSNFWTNYAGQAVFCAVFGMTSGAYVGLTSVVLVDLLGLDNLTNAFGLLMLFQGIASVIGPPFIGFLYDHFKNYHAGYYFAGAMIFLSGVMLFALPSLIKRQQKLEEKAIAERHKNESGFPEIAEEESEKFDPDDNPQMTMEARS